MVAVVGPVGSGKSSLCQALIREMELKGGHSAQGGSVAYVAQQVCIMTNPRLASRQIKLIHKLNHIIKKPLCPKCLDIQIPSSLLEFRVTVMRSLVNRFQ